MPQPELRLLAAIFRAAEEQTYAVGSDVGVGAALRDEGAKSLEVSD
jgi:hypothetical protein